MLRRFLGLDRDAGDSRIPTGDSAPAIADSDAETATARRIVARLEALPHEQARYLACFAYVMSRAANADFDISADETRLMERFVVELGGLDEAQAVLVVEMAKLQARTQGGTEDFVVTREFRAISTPEQRRALLHCCFAIEAADGSISALEASTVNEIARELDVERDELNAIRDEFHEQLAAVQELRRAGAASPGASGAVPPSGPAR
ncbi:MAG TPA: TerB family tellurite resistance protein [Candidatus Limnocylindrales bacterium]|nr:TerB family tellurite resistance protein [Candidatus Limnocylindrales bacterium]